MRPTSALGFSLAFALVVACDQTPTEPDVAPTFAAAKAVTVTTLAEWQAAIATAKPGATIAVEGTIEIPGGEERFLQVQNVTIEAATPGSGLRGVVNGGAAPECLVCLGADADGTTVRRLTLDGVTSLTPLAAAAGAANPLKRVTFTDNYVDCDGCAVHVFFSNAPQAVFTDNVLTGQPSFSAIQIQRFSTRAFVKDNWVEHGGGRCGIRVVLEADGAAVTDNTIASAPRNAICAVGAADGGTFRDNTILEITGVHPFTGVPFADAPSCLDGTSGRGTAGTGNTWVDNVAPVPSSPVGICGPTS